MIQAEHLTKQFGDFTALQDISCSIPRGKIYGMVGSNGAGKSTFLRILAGIYRPTYGKVTIDGDAVYEAPEVKKKVAFVPDDLYFLSGANMNRMAALYASMYSRFDRTRFRTMAADFGLDPEKAISSFSKGMRRQAITILALSCCPDYIFFDETFDGLDPIMRNYVKEIICRDVRERGASAIITSHSLRELEDTCDQLALLHKGGLVFESDIQNLKTAQMKIQIAFDKPYGRELFDPLTDEDIQIVNFVKHGSVSSMIVRGDRDEIVSRFHSLEPLLLDVLPLSLEEIFTYELETLGYSFNVDL